MSERAEYLGAGAKLLQGAAKAYGAYESATPPWVSALIKAAKELVPKEFVGRIEVNVFKGGVSNVNLLQSFKEDEAK